MTKYDKIIMNPPFKLGNKICSEVLKHCKGDVICLMPLSKYKAGKLYEHVDLNTFKLVDPKLFNDATITNNLSIATLKQNSVTTQEDDLTDLSYAPSFLSYYRYNRLHEYITSVPAYCTQQTLIAKGINRDTWFEAPIRLAGGNVPKTKDGHMYHWNVAKDIALLDLPTAPYEGNRNDIRITSFFYVFTTKKAKESFLAWFFSGNLSRKAITNLNKNSGSVRRAIPQIDWDKIDQDEDWKRGDYDKAVLKAMGMYMDTDGYIKEIEK